MQPTEGWRNLLVFPGQSCFTVARQETDLEAPSKLQLCIRHKDTNYRHKAQEDSRKPPPGLTGEHRGLGNVLKELHTPCAQTAPCPHGASDVKPLAAEELRVVLLHRGCMVCEPGEL